MKININETRLRRFVDAGHSAHEQVKAAAERVQDCRSILRDAEHELHRHERNPDAASARIIALRDAVEIARANVRDAVERHRLVSRDSADAQRLARRVQDFAAARRITL